MRFVLTYEDISLWMHNFLNLDMQVEAFSAENGQFCISSPDVGIRKLLPEGYRRYNHYFYIEAFDATCITINIAGLYGRDELFYRLFAKYVNCCCMAEVIEQVPYGRIKIHLERIHLMRDIRLQSFGLSEKGTEIEFAEDLNLYEHLRMLQLFLRAGYTKVRIIPEDMPYPGYWFSDDTLDYTLVMAEHPADIRLCSSFRVMEWMGMEGKMNTKTFHPVHPTTQINYRYGEVKVSIPVTIAEPEINATTIQRNCKRMQEEIAGAMVDVLDELQQPQLD